MPRLYLSNWGSHATPGRHGTGRKLSIMAIQRAWEHGEGTVSLFVPDPDAVRARHQQQITHEEYKEGFIYLVAFRIRHKGWRPEPGRLQANTPMGHFLVQDGDTLCCGCGTEKSKRDRCHRNWVAAFCVLAGWEVILDGEPMSLDMAKDRLSVQSKADPA